MRIGPLMLSTVLLGCATRHTVAPPSIVDPNRRVEIGPIVDDNGVDLAPIVSSRLRERRLADAHVVSEPSGRAPYVDGRVRATRADGGASGSSTGAVVLIDAGFVACVFGGVFVVVPSVIEGGKEETKATMTAIGVVALVAGVAMLVPGIALATKPGRYMEADISADLTLHQGKTSRPLAIHDQALVRHPIGHPEDGGGPLLDGVANGIAGAVTEAPK